MTCVVELEPEIAHIIEAQATQKGVKPEEYIGTLAGDAARAKEARRVEVRAMAQKLFDDYAPAFGALAEGAK